MRRPEPRGAPRPPPRLGDHLILDGRLERSTFEGMQSRITVRMGIHLWARKLRTSSLPKGFRKHIERDRNSCSDVGRLATLARAEAGLIGRSSWTTSASFCFKNPIGLLVSDLGYRLHVPKSTGIWAPVI